jgi:rubredoxin
MVRMRRMRPGPDFSCRDCGPEFVTEDALRQHQQEMHPRAAGAMRCRLCGHNLGDAKSLERHHREEHGVEVAETVPCGECGLVFEGPDALEEHIDREHPQRAGMGKTP